MPSRKSSSNEVPPSEGSQAGTASANPWGDAVKTWEDALMQHQFEVLRGQGRAAAVVERVRKDAEAELQRRWIEAYRTHAEALNALYVTGPQVQEAAQAWQRLTEAVNGLNDVQPLLRATQEAGQAAAQRLAEAGAEADAAERSRQVYAEYLAQLASIWDRRAALEAAQRAQQAYYDRLRVALESVSREAAASQQRYLAEVNSILADDTMWQRLGEELKPIQQELAETAARAEREGIDALIDGLRAQKARLTPASTSTASSSA